FAQGGARGRRRSRRHRHEDARHRRRVRQRSLDRQPAAPCADPAARVGDLRHPGQRAGRDAVVEEALRAPRPERVRQPAHVALRELVGGGVFQMPADCTVMHDGKLRQLFEQYWQTPQLGALERMKLYKLAWDLIGSEFAGRHLQYEKFYAGASFIVRNHSFREAPWQDFHRLVEDLMASYDIPPKHEKTRSRRVA